MLPDGETLILPCGDALQNPYWPQGLGINRGMHHTIDAVWAVYLAACGMETDVVIQERKFAFRLVDWKTFNIGCLTSGKSWGLDPISRYSMELVKSIHMHDLESGAVESSIPERYRAATGIRWGVQEKLE